MHFFSYFSYFFMLLVNFCYFSIIYYNIICAKSQVFLLVILCAIRNAPAKNAFFFKVDFTILDSNNLRQARYTMSKFYHRRFCPLPLTRMHFLIIIAQGSISLLVCNVDQSPFMVICATSYVGNHRANPRLIKGSKR